MEQCSERTHDRHSGCTHHETIHVVEVFFVAVFFVFVLVPLAGIPFAGDSVEAEKRDLAPEPSLVVDDRPNLNVLQDAGAWFEDHFAFRGELVDLDATIKERLFAVSATENVVVGSNGWLYYAGTLNDYQRRGPMSEHALKNAAKNISLMQEWVTSQGKGFAFAIAPNKNTLYPQYMPYYEIAVEGQSNLERLMPLLEGEDVRYVDLRAAFEAQDKILYFARDSHWNGEGALLAYRSIADMLPTPLEDFANDEPAVSSHVGDVDQMLHPQTAVAENDLHWPFSDAWRITNEATGVEDNTISTSSTAKYAATASLVMYRDSFGNKLLPYFASAYANATFSKLVPYDIGPAAIRNANDIVVERAERHLDLFATQPPYMPSPIRQLGEVRESTVADGTDAASIHVSANGPYLVVEGTLDEEKVGEDAPVYVELSFGDGKRGTVEAFHLSQSQTGIADTEGANAGNDSSEAQATPMGDWGYRAFFYVGTPDTSTVHHVRVMCGDTSAPLLIAEM